MWATLSSYTRRQRGEEQAPLAKRSTAWPATQQRRSPPRPATACHQRSTKLKRIRARELRDAGPRADRRLRRNARRNSAT